MIQYNIVNAFVYIELDKDMFIKMLLEYRRTGTILKLNKALYSLQRSPILWQRLFTKSIKELGFELVPYKPCCFIKNGIIIFFYIDNIVFAFKEHQQEIAQGLIK